MLNRNRGKAALTVSGSIRSAVRSGLDILSSPVYALPLDLFRILAGLLSFAYFAHALWDMEDISAPHGLIDHRLSLQLFPYTEWSLFRETTSSLLQVSFLGGMLISVALAAGCRPSLCAAFLYVLAVSTYRWNFLVLYIDDAIVHWILLWLVLLPVGHTLVWGEWRREGQAALTRWRRRQVPGVAVRCFLVNLALIYAAAGLWKWTSPMWRDGSALFAILKLPIAWTPDVWAAAHLPWLEVANYLALAAEPLFFLLLVLPPGRPLKWALLVGLLVFHGTIIATLKIPYANLACLAGAALWGRHELMAAWGTRKRPAGPGSWGWRGAGAVVLTVGLALQAVCDFAKPRWRYDDWPVRRPLPEQQGLVNDLHRAVYAVLWTGGLAQSYRLLDWIDSHNYHVGYKVRERQPGQPWTAVTATSLFPDSMRGVLLQSYLHGVNWRRIPPEGEQFLRSSLLERFASRYCRGRPGLELEVEVEAQVQRITAENARLERGRDRPLMDFTCRSGEAFLREPGSCAGW